MLYTATNVNQNALNFNLEITDKLSEICSSLLEPFGITFFAYYKFFQDGKILRISNHSSWAKIYFEREYYNDVFLYQPHFQKVQENSSYASLWIAQPTSMIPDLNDNRIGNGLTIYKKTPFFAESYVFATAPENTQINLLYVNNLDKFRNLSEILNEKISIFLSTCNFVCLIKSKLKPLSYTCPQDTRISQFLKKISS